MWKMASSVILTSFAASTYKQRVRLGVSLAAALLEDHFDHPANSRRALQFCG
jgi:hypothetical protein